MQSIETHFEKSEEIYFFATNEAVGPLFLPQASTTSQECIIMYKTALVRENDNYLTEFHVNFQSKLT